ncbi:hypothetical protein AGMMS49992_07630 [Clostridia bacterium]|nr:hypothetical protein AGMMS49992_07630 [Clostridia bacterium]
MKKFEQPVVALNEMMMSESIASICCYSQSTVGDFWGTQTVTKTVLNGGSLGTSGSSDSRYRLNANIINHFGGITPLPSYHYVYRQLLGLTGGVDIYPDGFPVGGRYADGVDLVDFHTNAATSPNNQGTIINFLTVKNAKANLGWSLPTHRYDYIEEKSGSWQLCNHLEKGCPWVDEIKQTTTANQHSGSTTAHALGGPTWWNSHPAQQYSS